MIIFAEEEKKDEIERRVEPPNPNAPGPNEKVTKTLNEFLGTFMQDKLESVCSVHHLM